MNLCYRLEPFFSKIVNRKLQVDKTRIVQISARTCATLFCNCLSNKYHLQRGQSPVEHSGLLLVIPSICPTPQRLSQA